MLGGLRVISEGRVVTRFRTQKTAALLACLALNEGGPLLREQLAERLWPDGDRTLSLHSLRVSLSSLRRQLEPPTRCAPLLLTDRTTAWLDPRHFATDVKDFQAHVHAARTRGDEDRAAELALAAGLYHGPLLAGIYEPWIGPHQIRLECEYLSCANELVTLLENRGDLENAMAIASRTAAIDPVNESIQAARLRIVLATAGPTAAARLYREIATAWQDLLGEEAPPALRSIGRALPQNPVTGIGTRVRREGPLGLPDQPAGRRNDRKRTASREILGRDAEIDVIAGMLATAGPSTALQNRLVTLTGPGGIGKTRLAQQVLSELAGHYEGRAWFVSLSSIRDPDRLFSSLREGMRLPGAKDVPPIDAVVDTLSAGPSLLVLDNLEQLRGAANLIGTLIERVDTVTCLVTSRTPLGLPFERVFPVRPLPVPAPTLDAAVLARIPSVELFAQRARQAQPDFKLTEQTSRHVAEICRRLEGIPLSIELAAARCYAMPPARILARMHDRFELLAGRDSALEGRHRSLRAAVGWSYDLLSPENQALFRTLHVFRDGFTAAASMEVAGQPDAEAGLRELLSASLISQVHSSDPVRYHILETIREFAELMTSAEERTTASVRHARCFTAFGAEAAGRLSGAGSARWLQCLDADKENIRSALDWCERNDTERGLDLSSILWRFWLLRGSPAEGRERIERFLDQTPDAPPLLRARALFGAGVLATEQSDYDTAKDRFTARLAIVRALGDTREEAVTLNALGNVAREAGNLYAARDFLDRALRIRRELADPGDVAASLVNLSNVISQMNDFAESNAVCEEALVLLRPGGDRSSIAAALAILGNGVRHLGDPARALEIQRESLEHYTALGSRHGAAAALHNMGSALIDLGRIPEGREAIMDALAINRELGHRAWEASNLDRLAEAALADGEADAAILSCEALRIRQELGDPGQIAAALHRCAQAAARSGNAPLAVRLFATADRGLADLGITPTPRQIHDRDTAVEQIRGGTSEEEVSAWRVSGHHMKLAQAVDEALNMF